jgi:hypothetical protein
MFQDLAQLGQDLVTGLVELTQELGLDLLVGLGMASGVRI